MGCGASAKAPPAPLDDEQKQKVCNVACKEMCILTASHAIKQFDKLVVDPPDIINQFDDNATRLREGGEKAGEIMKDVADKAGNVAQAAADKVDGGGLFGKLAGFAADVVDKATEFGADAAAAGVKTVCDKLADGMNGGVQKIRDPFTQVGRDIVSAKEKEITECFITYINGYDFPGAFALVRENHDTAVSDNFTIAMVQPLAKLLLPIVQPEIEKHAVTKYWGEAIEFTNDAISEIRELEKKMPGDTNFAEKYGPKPIELDLKIHIVTKVIEQMAKLFGDKETELRGAPDGQSRKPRLFKRCFAKPYEELNTDDLKDEHDPKVTYG